MPSVASAATIASTGNADSARTAPTAISWLRPPLPSPRTVTVVSPPARKQTGGGTGCPLSTHSRRTATRARATSRASPSSRVVRTTGRNP
jgi:hypothetical protein